MRDVRMVQRGEHFGFPLKPGQAVAISRDGLRQHLDGHGALQVRVRGAPYLAHPADADAGDDFVGAETGAGGKGQR